MTDNEMSNDEGAYTTNNQQMRTRYDMINQPSKDSMKVVDETELIKEKAMQGGDNDLPKVEEEGSKIVMQQAKKKRVTTSKSGQHTKRPPISGKNFLKMNMKMLQSATVSRHYLGQNGPEGQETN